MYVLEREEVHVVKTSSEDEQLRRPSFSPWRYTLGKFREKEDIYKQLEELGLPKEQLKVIEEREEVSIITGETSEYLLRVRDSLATLESCLSEEVKLGLQQDFKRIEKFEQEGWDY